jgi:hypothetical protein
MTGCLNETTLQAWLDGELSPEASAAVHSHVSACSVCAADASAARKTLALADSGWKAELPAVAPTARLRARLQARLEGGSVASPEATGFPGGLNMLPRWGIAAAIVVLGIATAAIVGTRSPQPTTPVLTDSSPKSVGSQGRPSAQRRPTGIESETTRHLEQTQQLLRSIRNADSDGVFDVAYELELSRDLLSRNRLLRRRAAQKDDTGAEKVLVHVEPILLDIANLSDMPVPDEINSLKEMIRAEGIIGELQRYAARVGL